MRSRLKSRLTAEQHWLTREESNKEDAGDWAKEMYKLNRAFGTARLLAADCCGSSHHAISLGVSLAAMTTFRCTTAAEGPYHDTLTRRQSRPDLGGSPQTRRAIVT